MDQMTALELAALLTQRVTAPLPINWRGFSGLSPLPGSPQATIVCTVTTIPTQFYRLADCPTEPVEPCCLSRCGLEPEGSGSRGCVNPQGHKHVRQTEGCFLPPA